MGIYGSEETFFEQIPPPRQKSNGKWVRSTRPKYFRGSKEIISKAFNIKEYVEGTPPPGQSKYPFELEVPELPPSLMFYGVKDKATLFI